MTQSFYIELDPQSRRIMDRLRHFDPQGYQAVQRGIRQGLYFTGKELVQYAKVELRKPKHGRLYRIKGRQHRASAPGEFPARLTGNLIQNMDFEVRTREVLAFGNNAEYAKYLERGTRRMAARPYLKPTILANTEQARRFVAERIMWSIEQELRG